MAVTVCRKPAYASASAMFCVLTETFEKIGAGITHAPGGDSTHDTARAGGNPMAFLRIPYGIGGEKKGPGGSPFSPLEKPPQGPPPRPQARPPTLCSPG